MTYEIHYSKAADRDLSKLPIEISRNIVQAIHKSGMILSPMSRR